MFSIWLAKNKVLCAELLWRAHRDQQVRNAWINPRHHRTVQQLKEFIRVDLANTRRMHQIIARHGWPGKTIVGPNGEQAAWLLIQHADHDPAFQKDCLALLEKTAQEDNSANSLLAYLTDRVRINAGLPQIYGTQFRGNFQPFTIENEEQVDERRKKAGLIPLSEYLDQVSHVWTNHYSDILTETKQLLSQLPPSEEYDTYVTQMMRVLNMMDNA